MTDKQSNRKRRIIEKRRRVAQIAWHDNLNEEDLDKIIAVYEATKQRQREGRKKPEEPHQAGIL